jgi:hypothetical protein
MSLIRVDISIKGLFDCFPASFCSAIKLRQGRKFTQWDSPAFGKNWVLSPVAAHQSHGSVISVEGDHLFI